MISSFDWIRRSRTGAELLATLKYLKTASAALKSDLISSSEEMGPPHSALNSPCQRCWVYPRIPGSDQEDELYCKTCKVILIKSRGLGRISQNSVVIWGFVNILPKQLQNKIWLNDRRIPGAYIHDENRFLLVMYRRELKNWIQELVLYNGTDLRGLIQILPTTGAGGGLDMADILCRAIHHETNFPMDQLRVRFYSGPYQILTPYKRDKAGILTFEVSEFLNLMGMVMVFRSLLRPEEQKTLYEILTMNKNTEEQFFWGRFQGSLSQEARDMLNAWKIRHWPKERVKLLYDLTKYVELYQFH